MTTAVPVNKKRLFSEVEPDLYFFHLAQPIKRARRVAPKPGKPLENVRVFVVPGDIPNPSEFKIIRQQVLHLGGTWMGPRDSGRTPNFDAPRITHLVTNARYMDTLTDYLGVPVINVGGFPSNFFTRQCNNGKKAKRICIY